MQTGTLPQGPHHIYFEYYSAGPKKPLVFFLPGYISNTQSTKGQYTLQLCQANELNWLSVDYLGHGNSSGKITDCGILDWLTSAQRALHHIKDTYLPAKVPLLLVGSSLGSWLALLLALELAQTSGSNFEPSGLITLAAAPDFTSNLRLGHNVFPNPEVEGTYILQEGEFTLPAGPALLNTQPELLVLPRLPDLTLPVELIHGEEDDISPWANSLNILKGVNSSCCRLHLIKGADHGLTDPHSLNTLKASLLYLAANLGAN